MCPRCWGCYRIFFRSSSLSRRRVSAFNSGIGLDRVIVSGMISSFAYSDQSCYYLEVFYCHKSVVMSKIAFGCEAAIAV